MVAKVKESRLPLESFTVHDLRRTRSTILNELRFDSDWIEKCRSPSSDAGMRWCNWRDS